MQCSKQGIFGFGVLDFPDLGFILAPFCFGFGASDFGFEFDGFVSVRGAAFEIRISDFHSLGFIVFLIEALLSFL